MDDLHKPLGQKQPKPRPFRFGLPALALAAVCLAGYIAYIFFQEEQSKMAVAAINGPLATAPTKTPAVENAEAETPEEAELALNAENGEEGEFNTPPPPPKPSFKPKNKPGLPVSNFGPLPVLVEKSEFGLLPKTAENGMRPLDAYSMSAGSVGPNRVAIVVGGLGLSQSGTQAAIADLPAGITLGFSPYGNSLNRWMQRARKEGHEVVLQLPMEPLGFPAISPGEQTLNSKSTHGENLRNLRWLLGRMTNYPIVMNYLGAGMAGRPDVLHPILEEVKTRGLGWLDDGSVQASKVLEVAESLNLPNATGSFVLDNVRDPARIDAQLTALELLSKRRGYAIASASAFPETIAQIKKWAKKARKKGILIVPVSNLMKDYPR